MEPGAFVDALARAEFGDARNFYRHGERAPGCGGLAYGPTSRAAPRRRSCSSGRRPATAARVYRGSRSPPSGSSPGAAPPRRLRRSSSECSTELGLQDELVLWNVVPAHPAPPGRADARTARRRGSRWRRAGLSSTRSRPGGERSRSGASPAVRWGSLGSGHPSRGGASAFARGCYNRRSADAWSAAFLCRDENLEREACRRPAPLVPRRCRGRRRSAGSPRRSPTRCAAKRKPEYTPHVDTGDFVVVVNAEKIAVTGKKLEQKQYYRHSGYPGGLRSRTLAEQLERRPTEVLRKAVKGMLPAQPPRPCPDHEAEGLRRAPSILTRRRCRSRCGVDTRRAKQSERHRAVPRDGQAQDVGRAGDPATRGRVDLDQRPPARGVLPA